MDRDFASMNRMEGQSKRGPKRRKGFTILELLVSMAILSLLLVLLFNIVTQVTKLWRETTGSIGEWKATRIGYESLVRRISQATLDTTWAYFDGPNGSGSVTTTDPVSYGRYSRLQFVSGPASDLLPTTPDVVTQAVFFQAPLGRTSNRDLEGLPYLLNACGYYIQYNNDVPFRPNTPLFQGVAGKWRFRLMELVETSEKLAVYSSTAPTNFDWFKNPIAAGRIRPLADNVVALILTPRFSQFDTTVGSVLAPDYHYNSRVTKTFNSGTVKGNTLHQLPPLLEVTMVVIDESSAIRLQDQYGSTMPPGLLTGAPFTDSADFEDDLKQLEDNLIALHLKYRVFNSTVAIRAAKWSGDEQ